MPPSHTSHIIMTTAPIVYQLRYSKDHLWSPSQAPSVDATPHLLADIVWADKEALITFKAWKTRGLKEATKIPDVFFLSGDE
ncbi:hypothetical protein PAXINDRAFT_21849 [Paxillus involutus ATCC 200175]|uniref:Uncharacterized protein n=1 Tax=Paxillus involutus ATCC 200175 TaxID=664439 RepID=A0A0C9TC69_PAXIN|nr:hypothetical protein PAXINDRAFT_21849 [Paxillus involutus ATCC 200175]